MKYEITYRLADGRTRSADDVSNLSADPMPIALAFHPYYASRMSPRPVDRQNPARKIVIADNRLVALASSKRMTCPIPCRSRHPLDTGFTDLERDSDGRAHFRSKRAG